MSGLSGAPGGYAERASRVGGAVVWTKRPTGETTVVPDGCLDVLWFGDHLLVAGPDTLPQVSRPVDGVVVGLRFAPAVGPAVLGVPAYVLRDRRVRLDELWGRAAVDRWHRALETGGRHSQALERLAGERLEQSPASDEMTHVAALCRQGHRVDRIARDLGWSERTLRRRSQDAFGYGAKVLARILRFQRASVRARAGVPLSDVAADTGYADQAHFSREVRTLSGRPASALLG